MANTKTCWKCCRQCCSLTARLLLPFFVCRVLLHIAISYECFILWLVLWLAHVAVFIFIMLIIARLFGECAWYDEGAEDEHCHLWDTQEKMEQAKRRAEQRQNEMLDDIQVQMDEIRALLLRVWNGGL
ncbi:hypothetical protein F5Y04DRAFT_274244 [Hypomontagnella monticulosa]|nr:hypothetical protein F5Y04DRAFT_274244 [Hypomontagnella monticulosa]